MERVAGNMTSVDLPLSSPASLQTIFDGASLPTSGSLTEWRALSGYGYQVNCNLQGFNVEGQPANGGVSGQSNARIGIYFNDQNNCDSPDSGRVVGGSSVSIATSRVLW